MMQRLGLAACLCLLLAGAMVSPVRAESLALKIAPLQYQAQIPLGKSKIGYIDVSNPTTNAVTLRTEVEAFKQVDADGNLAFYPDESLSAGIIPDLREFQLGPKEAIRVTFRIDPNKLHRGGVYGAVFFNIVPPKLSGSGSQVATSARLGTLFILTIGDGGTKNGLVDKLRVPFINLGNDIQGSFSYKNTAVGSQPVAFNPKLQLKIGYFGSSSAVRGPLVLPGSTRTIKISKKGSFIGLIPVKLTDATTPASHSTTTYIVAITGYWRLVALVLVGGVLGYLGARSRKNLF